jgi:hypothetical protein
MAGVKDPAGTGRDGGLDADAEQGRPVGAGGTRQPGILARVLGSMLGTVREIAGLSYEEAAARLGCEPDWLVRAETGFEVAVPEEVERWLAARRTGPLT